ncbi:glutamate decarboxylase [Labrenzia sp. VG12]|uniref:glutamate decarboxylase n=1 Tax=Labrenzia sp. VG12 TaxID=2021862 RepID=UPI000B8C18B5|nr:glutamate decarboxylase [Labrenzia sp. VG12]ASP34990.1 glutamate decarboxylase [Labrenzia sp. VG12]
MPLYQASSNRRNEVFDLYTRDLSEQALPKYRMPENSSLADTVYNLIHDELLLDGNSRQNLATFCTTYASPQVQQLMQDCVDKNMIDKDEYPQTAEIENRCVHILADLWNAPDSVVTQGCSTTGSSEAAMLGGLALKWKWRKKREAEGKPADKPNLICGPVQICWHKFARYFDIELRELPILDGELGMRPDQIAAAVDENTIGVVATLGVTFTCVYEPVEQISAVLDQIQAERGLDIPLHIDAASGGFIAPFLHKDVVWDFRLPRVKSINASGHKYGLAPLGVGWVVWREKEDLPEELIFNVDYLGGQVPTFALNFSRPAGEIIAQYYQFLRLGKQGYTDVQGACANAAQYLADELEKTGHFDILYNGDGGLPAACYSLKDSANKAYTLYDISERMRMRGWQIASYPLPHNRRDLVVQRVLVRHGMGKDLMALLVDDMKRTIEFLDRNPLSNAEAGPTFHHGR